MKNSLKIEELAQLILGIVLFSQLQYPWWVFAALFLMPDIGMLGYFVNTKVGAVTYNIFHHKGIAVAILVLGILFLGDIYTLAGIILFSHSAFDRALGYGLKYPDSFKNTHLGKI
jgi:hypothetical protein